MLLDWASLRRGSRKAVGRWSLEDDSTELMNQCGRPGFAGWVSNKTPIVEHAPVPESGRAPSEG